MLDSTSLAGLLSKGSLIAFLVFTVRGRALLDKDDKAELAEPFITNGLRSSGVPADMDIDIGARAGLSVYLL
eukprot:CAMPEP_0185924134 /NCGR_PEP_ID=MMETSP0924C-20121207/12060_1 /TAXON_ID=321610 /ORGANISM="Perkinsus chesapeaki, Strain ATCC PRA-65" /LENGTH=71 /DNA_ID=CAMNT_0028658739 /DNA_START=23 /DNA_END=238 /DNA_ORIENTATION=+